MRADYIETGGVKHAAQPDSVSLGRRVLRKMGRIFRRAWTFVRALGFLRREGALILANQFVVVSAGRTFGHDLQFFDVVSRMYSPRKLSWIYIPGEIYNPYLLRCFEHNIRFYKFSAHPEDSEWIATVFKMFLYFLELQKTRWPDHYVVDPRHVVQTLSVDEGRHSFAAHATPNKRHVFHSRVAVSQYRHLILNKVGVAPALPPELETQCREAIEKIAPEFFDKPVAALVLRRKGLKGIGLNGPWRMAGPHENYHAAIAHIAESGFHVVGTGDTLHEPFEDIPGYYSLIETQLDPRLINMFVACRCKLYLGQSSGPFPLATSCGARVLLTDVLPFAASPIGPNDMVLYKHILVGDEEISIAKAFAERPDLAFPDMIYEPRLRVNDNTGEEILMATKEMCARTLDKNGEENYQDGLLKALKELAPDEANFKYYDAKLPSFCINTIKNEIKIYTRNNSRNLIENE